jgi:hypothetical protein
MKCPHCLRGNAQNLDFNPEWLNKFIAVNKISDINCVVFSGGEPSLVPDIIQSCLNIFIAKKVSIESFYLTTNAQDVSNDFISVLLNLGIYAYTCDGEIKPITIAVSNDKYHFNHAGFKKEVNMNIMNNLYVQYLVIIFCVYNN